MRLVGRYEILGQLGEGGMATVYLARQPELDRRVALKELRSLSSSDPSFAKRFLREARMAGSLSHPSIVTVHDYFEADGVPYIAMEYMERGSLRPYIGQMSLAQVGGVMQSLLAGLQYAGERGIVHRDLKPENLMVSGEGSVKIADFGIAKARNAFQTGGALTADGTALGTPNYMAPEQAMAEEVGTWTDIYAVGVVAFEIFVGHPPFADTPQPLMVIMRQVKDPIPLVTEIDPSIDPRIAHWIAWLTSKEPRDRPQSAAEAWDALEGIVLPMLGPRWQRSARLQPLAAPIAVETQPLDPTRRSMTVPASAAAAAVLEPTAMPNGTRLLNLDRTDSALPPDGAPPQRKGRMKRALVVLALAGAFVAFAAAAMRPTSSGAPAEATPPPKDAKHRAAQVARPIAAARQPAAATAAPRSGSMRLQAAQARRLARQYNSGAGRIESLAATGAQLDSNALIPELMRKTAREYSAAARAADRGDENGYARHIAAARVARGQVDQAARRAPKSIGSSSSSGDAPSSACSGDSVSDDPSDDSCGSEP